MTHPAFVDVDFDADVVGFRWRNGARFRTENEVVIRRTLSVIRLLRPCMRAGVGWKDKQDETYIFVIKQILSVCVWKRVEGEELR